MYFLRNKSIILKIAMEQKVTELFENKGLKQLNKNRYL